MQFQYKAIKDDKIVVKKIDAESEQEVVNHLKANDYFPIEIKRYKNTLFQLNKIVNSLTDKLSEKDIIDFTRQLAIMLNAGLTLTDTLKILQKQTSKKSLLAVIQTIDDRVRAGNPFSSALKLYPQHFTGLYISLVRAGEASGKLNEIMMKLSESLEKNRAIRGKIKSAMIYPGVIFSSMIVVVFIVLTFVVPKLLELYEGFGAELPISTQIILAISNFSSKFWFIIVIIVSASVIGMKKFLKTERGKFIFDTISLRIPYFNSLVKMTALVENTRTLSLMVAAGVPILDSLQIIVQTTDNLVFRNAFRNSLTKVEKGMSLGDAFFSEKVFPPILVQMTLVGENTGRLDDTLMRLSNYFEMESELAIKALTSLIEPATLIILGLGVGVLVISIISPIYNLTSGL